METAAQGPRRSSRLLSQQHKRHNGLEEQHCPSGKRPCTAVLAGLDRSGSVESECTQLGAACRRSSPADVPHAAAAAARNCSPASDVSDCPDAQLFTPGSYGSDDSQQTPLDDALLMQPGSLVAAAGPAAAAAVGASGVPAPAAAATAAATQPAQASARQQQWAQDQGRAQHPHLPPSFLAELAQANAVLQRLPLPGGMPFYPVHPSCALLPLCCIYGLSPAAIVMGVSYFQRLLLKKDHLRAAADQAGFFAAVPGAQRGTMQVVMHARPGTEVLIAAYCACVYLGVKVTDGVSFSNQLSHMLSNALGTRVEPQQAEDLEMQVLQLLDWRLGPYTCRPNHMGSW